MLVHLARGAVLYPTSNRGGVAEEAISGLLTRVEPARRPGGRPKIAPELRPLIKRMWQANPKWGSPRIVSEFKMLGIDVAKSTVEQYKARRGKPPSPSWRTFLEQHAHELASIDFFIVPTATLKVLFVLLVLVHDWRRIVHFNVWGGRISNS